MLVIRNVGVFYATIDTYYGIIYTLYKTNWFELLVIGNQIIINIEKLFHHWFSVVLKPITS